MFTLHAQDRRNKTRVPHSGMSAMWSYLFLFLEFLYSKSPFVVASAAGGRSNPMGRLGYRAFAAAK